MILLASASPRRAELLRSVGIAYRPAPQFVDETPADGESAQQYVERVAVAKARSAAGEPNAGELPVLAADTCISLAGRILGKPVDIEDYRCMMSMLSGQQHQVLSAVALLPPGDTAVRARLVVSDVEFRPLSRSEIEAYWLTGEPADKAGGYAIQGRAAAFVRRLTGSYSGVVGLPICETLELLAEAGVYPDWTGNE